jgi:hypothetical protein
VILAAILAIKLFALAVLVRVEERVVRFRAKPEIEQHSPFFATERAKKFNSENY